MPIHSDTRRAPTWLLVTVLVLLLPWSWFVNLWYAPRELYKPLLDASGGLLYPTFQTCLPTVLCLIALVKAAGLRLRDIGWRGADLGRAVIAIAAVWLFLNAVGVISHGSFEWASGGGLPTRYRIGQILGQFMGNALFEETVYRGFVLAQFALILSGRGAGPKKSAWLAAVLSSIVFALPHIPNRILSDSYQGVGDVVGDQLKLVVAGMIFAWIYLRTKNLWWAIGIHSLTNYPSLVCEWGWSPSQNEIATFSGVLVTAAWPWIFRSKGGTAGS